ncbi:hypothetical protein B0T10DRAFT_454842 [Thelonectria olida]|uniref:Uncharacterized protein n=1 Tax=Thelonectria olida TaxID=1576542 RepID=A0A9P9ARP0_9HYPO|nr:hypothetical protein B0T10DRAFT_454842 [Thelonectria olida]
MAGNRNLVELCASLDPGTLGLANLVSIFRLIPGTSKNALFEKALSPARPLPRNPERHPNKDPFLFLCIETWLQQCPFFIPSRWLLFLFSLMAFGITPEAIRGHTHGRARSRMIMVRFPLTLSSPFPRVSARQEPSQTAYRACDQP